VSPGGPGRRLLGPVALVALAVALGGCLPAPATEQGQAVHDLWIAFLVPAGVVAAIVWGLVTISIVRGWRRRPEAGLPDQVTGHTGLEIVWTTLPILTVVVLFALSLLALGRIDAKAAGGIDVTVTAFRWQWQMDYPADGVSVVGTPDTPPVMVVPVGEPVHVTLMSRDVAHSFFVPQFLFKRDAIPGQPNHFDLTVETPGTYRGQCAEFCGIYHDRMLFSVEAVSPEAFDAWLASAAAGASTAPGASASPAGSAAP